jgi:hypothetical protein
LMIRISRAAETLAYICLHDSPYDPVLFFAYSDKSPLDA